MPRLQIILDGKVYLDYERRGREHILAGILRDAHRVMMDAADTEALD